MIIDLDKKMLSSLVRGINPDYGVMDHPLVKNKGQYWGGFKDEWQWSFSADDYSEQELWDTYQILVKPKPVEARKSHKAKVFEDDIESLEAILTKAKERGNKALIVVAERQLITAKIELREEQ